MPIPSLEGYWINYSTGRTFQVVEHEQFLRQPGNAKKLGVPVDVHKQFDRYLPVRDRNEFLSFVLANAALMRVRRHRDQVSFEYASASDKDPLEAVWLWASENAGPLTNLHMVNLAKNRSAMLTYQEFEEAMDQGGPPLVMRRASKHKLVSQVRGLTPVRATVSGVLQRASK